MSVSSAIYEEVSQTFAEANCIQSPSSPSDIKSKDLGFILKFLAVIGQNLVI